MALFSVSNTPLVGGSGGTAQINIGATAQSQLIIAASTQQTGPPVCVGMKRTKVYDMLVGTNGTPSDNEIEWLFERATVGTSVVWLGSVSSISSAVVLDLADQGPSCLLVMNASAETNVAVAGITWYFAMNSRASYRWIAAPGSEIIAPAVSSATAGSGLAMKARSAAYTSTVTTCIYASEL